MWGGVFIAIAALAAASVYDHVETADEPVSMPDRSAQKLVAKATVRIWPDGAPVHAADGSIIAPPAGSVPESYRVEVYEARQHPGESGIAEAGIVVITKLTATGEEEPLVLPSLAALTSLSGE